MIDLPLSSRSIRESSAVSLCVPEKVLSFLKEVQALLKWMSNLSSMPEEIKLKALGVNS
jgi:hypothetical protein